jgi:hypothetical protein
VIRAASVVLLAAALAAGGCAGNADEEGRARESPPLPRGDWVRVEPGGATRCARGGRYAFWARRGDSNRLVVYFQPGGGCFDVTTCAPGSTWFDDSVDGGDDPSFAGGIFDFGDPRNPFRDWSFVYIPVCTGDVHLGDRVQTYRADGTSVTVRHTGLVNARAALEWAFERFPAPARVFVTGCSAGSVGSAFHVPAVLARYPRAQVAQLGDSLAFQFHRPIRLVDWGAHRHFPSFFRIGARRFTMAGYLGELARRFPRRVFARFNFAGDDVQEQFFAAVGGDPDTFSRRLRRTEASLVRRLSNYRSFLACGDAHCALPDARFYSVRVDGVALRDWVAGLAAGRSVGCPRCG